MTGRPRTPAQHAGDGAEEAVARHLEGLGWTVLGRQVRVGRHELDLVAIDPGAPATLVAVEVRWRRTRDFGLPEETVDWRKRRHLRTAIFGLREEGRLPDGRRLPPLPVRIDLVVMEPPAATGGPPRLRHHRHGLGA